MIKLRFFSIIICILFGFQAPAWAEAKHGGYIGSPDIPPASKVAQKVCLKQCGGLLPPWPLPLLNKQEREGRIKFFLKREFKLSRHGNSVNMATCKNLLDEVKNESFSILEPEHIIKRPFLNNPFPVSSACTNIQDMRIYASPDIKFEINTNEFEKLPAEKKEAISAYSFQSSANVELYDLSRFLGKNTWGYLGEGAVASCHAANKGLCSGRRGYAKYSGQIGSVFNSMSCEIEHFPWLLQNFFRLRTGTDIGFDSDRKHVDDMIYYWENPAFISYILIRDLPFLVGIVPHDRWSNFSNISGQNTGADVLIHPLEGANSNVKEKICIFSSQENSLWVE